jgi:hypothetical protein
MTMKAAIKFTLLFVVIIFLGACATSGPKFSEYRTQIQPANPELGRIFFYRTSVLGAALRPNVVLNNETVGEAIARGFFYVDRAPGEYIVVTSTEVNRKASFTLERGQNRYIRFGVSMGFFVGHVYPELVDEQVALSEISDCSLTGQTNQTREQK